MRHCFETFFGNELSGNSADAKGLVFNADQVTGWDGSWLQDDSEELVQEWDDHASADQFLATVPADVRHVNGNSAHYVPSQDYIQMPNREQFKDASGYYGTLFHELAHWSGHPTRNPPWSCGLKPCRRRG